MQNDLHQGQRVHPETKPPVAGCQQVPVFSLSKSKADKRVLPVFKLTDEVLIELWGQNMESHYQMLSPCKVQTADTTVTSTTRWQCTDVCWVTRDVDNHSALLGRARFFVAEEQSLSSPSKCSSKTERRSARPGTQAVWTACGLLYPSQTSRSLGTLGHGPRAYASN